jgi:hypothetical protein
MWRRITAMGQATPNQRSGKMDICLKGNQEE